MRRRNADELEHRVLAEHELQRHHCPRQPERLHLEEPEARVYVRVALRPEVDNAREQARAEELEPRARADDERHERREGQLPDVVGLVALVRAGARGKRVHLEALPELVEVVEPQQRREGRHAHEEKDRDGPPELEVAPKAIDAEEQRGDVDEPEAPADERRNAQREPRARHGLYRVPELARATAVRHRLRFALTRVLLSAPLQFYTTICLPLLFLSYLVML